MQLHSGLPAGRSHDKNGREDTLPPKSSLAKVGGYAVVMSCAALVSAFLPFDPLSSLDADRVHAALTMVVLGVALTVIVTSWSSVGGRIRHDTVALIRAFTGVGALSAAYLAFSSFSRIGNGGDTAFSNVLHPGMGLTVAAGMLAASYLADRAEPHFEGRRWTENLPFAAAILVLALACAAGIAPWLPLPLVVGTIVVATLLLYGWAGVRLYWRYRNDPSDDLAYLLAAVATGLLAESLLSLPQASPAPRHLLGDVYRIAGFVLAYSALFHQVARVPFIELQRAETKLQSEQARLARARYIAKLGSWEWDLATDAVWTSEEVRRMFGIPADRIGMTRDDFENLIYREDLARLRSAAEQALEQNIPYSIDYRILGPDGSPLTMHSEAQIERDPAGKPLRMSGIVQDISDRVAVEHALRESDAQIRSMNLELEQRVAQRTRQLAAANKELEAFGYSVSHDLQAPLRRIERYAELLTENASTRLDDSERDMLGRIQDASSQTKRLISDMLKLSQITRAELRRVAVDLSALAQRVMEQIERATSPSRQVKVSVDPGMIVEADAAMLQILLDNLLGNAWKFTSKTEQPAIRVGAIEAAEGKGFYVSDNGAGFDMRYAHKLFGAFQRLHRQEEFKGTGIGLAIVQRIVNVHGWQIQASSEAGRGSIFTIKAQ